MNPPENAWDLHLYQHAPSHLDIVVTVGESEDALADGYVLIGTLMYCQPLVTDGYLEGTRYVFALHGREGTAHYDISHEFPERTLTIHEEPAVRADYDVSDADRDADARRAQAADEAYDTYMTRDRYYRR